MKIKRYIALIMTLVMAASLPVCASNQTTSSEIVTEETTEQSKSEDATTEETTEQPKSEEATTEQEEYSEVTTEETTEQPKTENPTEQITRNPDLAYTGLSPADSKVLVIDPGHCKIHPGASGNGLKEEVVVLDISLAMYEALKDYADITVYLTREDGGCCRNLGVGNDCLYARSNYAQQLDANFLVSIHINAGHTNGANALVAYKSGYHDNIRKETQAFGKLALKELYAIGVKNRGFLLRKSGSGSRYSNGKLCDYYAIVRRGVVDEIPGVIMEHGYITNASDCKKFFKTKAQRKKVGEADAKAMIAYYNLAKKTIAGSFIVENGETYYKNSIGQIVSGWVKSDGKWYYFDEMTGQMKKGMYSDGNNSFFLSPSTGEMVVGEFTLDGCKYMARGNGTLVKSAIHTDGVGTYLYDPAGKKLSKGFHTIDNNTYYVINSKKVARGLTKIGSKYYGFDSKTGVMATGWKKIKGKYYYFDEDTGKMAKSKWIGNYYVNKKGVRTKKK